MPSERRHAPVIDLTRPLHRSGARFCVYPAVVDGESAVAKRVSPASPLQHGPEKLLDREYKVLSTLNHAAIPRPLGRPWRDPQTGTLWLLMQRRDGRNLSDIITAGIQRRSGLGKGTGSARDWNQPTRDIVQQLAVALSYLHSAGVLHNDIKPDNILVHAQATDVEHGRLVVSLLDFESTGPSMAGTPAYAAPERIEGGKAVTERADVYSLALVIFELLTGVRPFADEPLDLALRKRREWPFSLEQPAWNPDLRAAIEHLEVLCNSWERPLWPLIKAALAPEPGRRPPSVRAFVRALEPELDIPSQSDGPAPMLAVALVGLLTCLATLPTEDSAMLRLVLGRPQAALCTPALDRLVQSVCAAVAPANPQCALQLGRLSAPAECSRRVGVLQLCLRQAPVTGR